MKKHLYLFLISTVSFLLLSSCAKGPDLFYEKETFLIDADGGEMYIRLLTSMPIEAVSIEYGIESPWIQVLDYGKEGEDTSGPSVTYSMPEKERYFILLNVLPNEGPLSRRAKLVTHVGDIDKVPVDIIQAV